MRTVPLALVLLLAVTAVPAGCAGTREAAAQASGGGGGDVRVDARDNGGRAELRAGGHLLVALSANYSTGYSWKVVSPGEPVLRQAGPPTYVRDSERIGAGGTATFEFVAEQKGTASLELVYVRPWEKDAKPAETFSLTVVVTE